MPTYWRTHTIALAAILVLVLAGCGHDGELASVLTPIPDQSQGRTDVTAGSLVKATPGAEGEIQTVTKMITPAGGVIAVGRVSVEFPKKSVGHPTRVTLMVFDSAGNVDIRIEPSSLELRHPVSLSFTAGTPVEGLTFFWLAPHDWVALDSTWNEEGDTLTAQTRGLGDFFIGTEPPSSRFGRAGW